MLVDWYGHSDAHRFFTIYFVNPCYRIPLACHWYGKERKRNQEICSRSSTFLPQVPLRHHWWTIHSLFLLHFLRHKQTELPTIGKNEKRLLILHCWPFRVRFGELRFCLLIFSGKTMALTGSAHWAETSAITPHSGYAPPRKAAPQSGDMITAAVRYPCSERCTFPLVIGAYA